MEEDDFVVVGKPSGDGVKDFVGFGEAEESTGELQEEAYIKVLKRDKKEEVMLFLDRDVYEMDVLKDFRDGRSSVWKQFGTDVHRQLLMIDGLNMRESSIPDIVKRMISVTARVLCKRQSVQTRAPSVVSYITSYLSPPQSGEAGADLLPSMTVNAYESHEIVVTSPLPDVSPSGVPAITPENSAIMRYVDTLAIFCQQGVLGLVFEILNKQYSQFNYNVYVDNCTTQQGTPVVSITEGLSDEGHPEVLVSIQKLFRLFQIDNDQITGATDIGFVRAELELGLFSRQKVQLKLQGS
eukprot:TRINITY_DN35291_c0_g1_i1.p1 TRINITY_DN35291_c0_g1~~TRINITY_DN35291_c0_g1_i1.p1  ORF type:complete len:316 (+),score=65.44 TRINITY_DN35291_c0_g1_i1:61-948(+)